VHKFTVSVAELLGKPGEYRDITVTEPMEGVAGALGRLADDRVDARLRLESVMEGILVTGRAEASTALRCARCLTSFSHRLEVELCELYAVSGGRNPERDDVYAIAGSELNLEPMLRDALALALPLNPICRADCRGICAGCGTELNFASCTCAEESIDPRWAALESLRERLSEQAEAEPPARIPRG
jgi:uncharacterized protein